MILSLGKLVQRVLCTSVAARTHHLRVYSQNNIAPAQLQKQHKTTKNSQDHNPMLQMRTLDDLCKSAVNALGINVDRKDCPITGESAMASTTYSTAQPRVASRNGTCTHLTMTRLYTDEFRCLICLRMSSMGWVWRCTQDRDMMLEDEANFKDVRGSFQFHWNLLLTIIRASWIQFAI